MICFFVKVGRKSSMCAKVFFEGIIQIIGTDTFIQKTLVSTFSVLQAAKNSQIPRNTWNWRWRTYLVLNNNIKVTSTFPKRCIDDRELAMTNNTNIPNIMRLHEILPFMKQNTLNNLNRNSNITTSNLSLFFPYHDSLEWFSN